MQQVSFAHVVGLFWVSGAMPAAAQLDTTRARATRQAARLARRLHIDVAP